MAKKKIQVVDREDDGSEPNLWTLLEEQGFLVVVASERKTPRYKGQNRRKTLADGRDNGDASEYEEHADATPQGLYEGKVKLLVSTGQRVRKVVSFVDHLRQNPGFRLLLMEATDRKDSVSILLGLREPTALGPALMAMEDVFQVEVMVETMVETTIEASGEATGGLMPVHEADSSEPVLQVTLG